MPGIVKGVEPNQISIQQGPEQLLAHRQRLVNLRRWEWAVKEETELHPVEPLAQERRQHHQMVIVHPHKVVLIGADHLQDLVCEDLVHGHVGLPQGAVKASPELRRQWQHVMEQWPQLLLAETVVEARPEVRGKEGGDAPEALEELVRHLVVVGRRDFVAQAADVDELRVRAAVVRAEAVLELQQEAVLVPREPPAAGRAAVGADGELVGDDDGALPRRVRGGGGGVGAVEVGNNAGRRHHARCPAVPERRQRLAAGVEVQEVGVGSRHHPLHRIKPRFELDHPKSPPKPPRIWSNRESQEGAQSRNVRAARKRVRAARKRVLANLQRAADRNLHGEDLARQGI
jgi:hypothetical protein